MTVQFNSTYRWWFQTWVVQYTY